MLEHISGMNIRLFISWANSKTVVLLSPLTFYKMKANVSME